MLSNRLLTLGIILISGWFAPALGRCDDSGRPNILICIADDWSYGHAGAYGCSWTKTPGFDQVAREGILFTNCYTPNAKCAPSRACLLTGRNSWQLREAANHMCPFPAQFKTFMEALGESGYEVGHTAKGWGPGTAGKIAGRPRQLTGSKFNQKKAKPPTQKISPIDYSSNFSEFLAANKADSGDEQKPWCFWYGALEPHRGYEYGTGVSLAGKAIEDVDRIPGFWPDNEVVRNDMLDYALEVEHFDSHVLRILNELEAEGILENTIVIVTSDHGMPFPRCKGQAYEMSNHIPLAIRWGKRIKQSGRVVSDYVSLIDVAPTLVQAAGLTMQSSGMASSPGRPLFDIFDSEKEGLITPDRDHVLIAKERHDIGRPDDLGYPIRGIFENGKLLIHNLYPDRWPAGNPLAGYLNCDGGATKTNILNMRRNEHVLRHWQLCFGGRPEWELYDVSNDPDCLSNLAELPEYQKLKAKLTARMRSRLLEQGDPRSVGEGDFFDSIEYTSAGTRNFYNRLKAGETLKAGWTSPSDREQTELTLDGKAIEQ